MRARLLLVSALTGTALLFGATPARATPNFPAAIESDLKLKAPPACTICHATNAGGEGTVTKPFGIAMETAGLQAYDVASLDTALATLKTDATSSAGDGIPDITKLEEGRDPNIPLNGSFGPEEPSFGCGAHIAPTGAQGSGGLPLEGTVLGLVLVWARARRRRREGGCKHDE